MGVFLVFLTCAEREGERETERQRETEKQRETETERMANHLVKLFLNESENVVAKEQSEIELDF